MVSLCVCALACGGSNDAPCGVGDAGSGAIALRGGGVDTEIGGLRWGQNNDCPAGGTAVVSVTISGGQTSPRADSYGLGLCLPRPDQIDASAVDLSDATRVQLVGASGTVDGCSIMMTSGARPSGTVTFSGLCTQAGAAWLMTLAGQVAGTKRCQSDGGLGTPEAVTIELAGQALITPR